ncbi:hypothetical protein FF38_03090 [Lucilia cuprina]|uniref:Uncharacterized protein n=1 Tax=Lucilia cuprina TaxID=7375 RepID=A0A0L0CJE3_LUCCU|nr:hypothetical protein FF38_03090 [Lucilia cuprina]
MRPYLITFACLCSALAFVTAVPVPASNQELDVLQIPLSNGKDNKTDSWIFLESLFLIFEEQN